MRRLVLALALAALLACDSIGSNLFSLGTFERSFSAAIDVVEIPSFDVEALLTPENVEALVRALHYDPDELRRAGADFADLQSVVDASVRIGAPLAARDAELREILSLVAEHLASDALSNEPKGLFVRLEVGALFEEPLDYRRLEASLTERALRTPVDLEVIYRTESIDTLLSGKAEILDLARSGWLDSLRIVEVGLRTLAADELARRAEGEGIRKLLQDPARIQGCVDETQRRMEGIERLSIALRSNAEDAAWIEILDEGLDSEDAICAWMTTLRSPELIQIISDDQGLELRVRVRTRLPAEPFLLGGYLWFDGESVTIRPGKF